MAIAHPPDRTKRPEEDENFYPSGDGKPMAEDNLHRDLMIYTIPALKLHFADRPDVYVSGNDFLYYEEGVPASRISPAHRGSPKRIRLHQCAGHPTISFDPSDLVRRRRPKSTG